ncbi:hypothetical protein EW026_g8473 [Hermanssonia centrifuga]|uniref:Uncharacterized protein n=1 Tax=Hermanssonia centrifuga TaxID=98765 RepID=A0A4S4K3Z8_9APHY|nr:hypothetical protein EW026_g8473 [Hermanssonia centrifuga]
MFAHYAPRLYDYYAKNFASLKTSQPELKLPVDTSIFTTISFNLASQVVASNFDPKLSGHFILWELKLLIEFPAGSIIIIPSALFSHGNVGLQAGETRTWKKFKKQHPQKAKAEWSARPTRWQEVLGLFSNVSEFASL